VKKGEPLDRVHEGLGGVDLEAEGALGVVGRGRVVVLRGNGAMGLGQGGCS